MSEFESYGRASEASSGPRSAMSVDAPRPRSSAAEAKDAIAAFGRETRELDDEIGAVHRAHDANDREGWALARARLDGALARADRLLEAARSRSSDASCEAKQQLEISARDLEVQREAATALVEAPVGFQAIAREAELLEVFAGPLDGGAKVGFERKESALKAEIDRLSPVDRRVLADRLRKSRAGDPIAAEVARLIPARRERLLEYLATADKRAAQRRERGAAEPAAARVDPPAPISLEHLGPQTELLDIKLRRALDDETELETLLATLDGGARQALATRLVSYRPGSGDEISARFTRLDQVTRERVLASLRATSSPRVQADATPEARPVRPGDIVVPEVFRTVPIATTAPATPATDAGTAKARSKIVIAKYLDFQAARLWPAIHEYLAGTVWPNAERLELAQAAFGKLLFDELRAALPTFEDAPLAALFYPNDLLAMVEPYMPAKDGAIWSPAVGLVLGQLVLSVLMPGVRQMTARYVDVADAKQSPTNAGTVELGELVTSHPMERVIARALVARGVATVEPVVSTGKRKPARVGLRKVALTWETDPRLWNVVRAEPGDATAEEVAASLFAYARDARGDATSYFAYGLAAAAPWFALPAKWAVMFPDAVAHAPEAIRHGQLPEDADDSAQARLATLATSSAADALAVQQAIRTPAGAATLGATEVATALGDSTIQLEHLRAALTPWGLTGNIIPAVLYIADKQRWITGATPGEVAAWAGVAVGQRDRLFRIAGNVTQLVSAARTMGQPRDAHHPLAEILRVLATAAATSHLTTTSEALIAQAQTAQAGLSLRALQANAVELELAMDQAHPGGAPGDKAIRDLAGPSIAARSDARLIEDKLLHGETVDPGELERVQINAQELSLRARLHATQTQLDQLMMQASKAHEGIAAHAAALFSGKFRDLASVSQFIHQAIGEVYVDLSEDQRHAKPRSGDADGLNPLPLEVSAKKEAVARAQQRFAAIGKEHDLATFFAEGVKLVEAQQFRTACVQTAAMIGITVLSGGIAGLARESIAAGYVAVAGVDTVEELALSARIGVWAGGTATEIVGNSIGQQLVMGDSMGHALIDNTLFTLGANATTSVIAHDVQAGVQFQRMLAKQAAAIEEAEGRVVSRMGAFVKWAGRQSIEITGHTVMGMALGALVAKLNPRDGGTAGAPGVQETILQGAAISIGKLVHVSIGERMPGLERLAKRRDIARGERLLADAQELEKLSGELSKSGNAMAALVVLDKQRLLLAYEIADLDRLAAEAGHTPAELQDLAQGRAELVSQLGNVTSQAMLTVRFHLVGLRELAPGTLWSGTHTEVERARREAERSAPGARVVRDADTGITTIRVDDQVIELHETSGPVQAEPTDDHAGTRPPEATHELSSAVVRVPGSEMRGQAVTKSPEHSAALLAAGNRALGELTGMSSVKHVTPHGKSYLIELADGSLTSIDISIARVDGSDVARLVPNTSRYGDGPNRKVVVGQHVIQLSETLALDQVDRAVAHAVARLIVEHEQSLAGNYPHGGSKLSTDDRGRAAELAVLARQIHDDPAHAAQHRREIVALVEYLGLRAGAPGAAERLPAIEAELDQAGRDALAEARREPATDAARAELAELRRQAEHDLAAEQATHAAQDLDRDAPASMAAQPGHRLTREQVESYAQVAAQLRWLVSERTIAKYRAAARGLPAGSYPKVGKTMRGGGAALSAREPDTLLIDLRGRWQADGGADIAQTGQQLHELYKARFGDVREVAGPNERVPLAAIRYWEDSLAAMGECIDGSGTYRMEGTKLLLDIVPSDGSGPLTIEVSETSVTATGFPATEMLPGGPRNISAYEVIVTVEARLRQVIDKKPTLKPAAEEALAKMEQIKTAREIDLLRVREAIGANGSALVVELQRENPATGTAVKAIDAREKWETLVADDARDGKQQLFFGKDTNAETIKATAIARDQIKQVWLFAGAGGTSVSGAEIILNNTKRAEVILAAKDTPSGLLANTQFRALAEAHGDAQALAMAKDAGIHLEPGKSDGRLHLNIDDSYYFDMPTMVEEHGAQRFKLRSEAGHGNSRAADVATGDMLVSSVGSAGQLPPDIAELALQARRADPDNIQARERMDRPVWVHADFAPDGRYVGYSVVIKLAGTVHVFEVTGAASRYLPEGEFRRMGQKGLEDLEMIWKSNKEEAPDQSGGFGGSFGPTSLQGRYHAVPERKPY